MGNNRGSLYGYGHENLSPFNKDDQEKFFDYSFYELGQHDAPAQIDYVRLKTKTDKIVFIGHS